MLSAADAQGSNISEDDELMVSLGAKSRMSLALTLHPSFSTGFISAMHPPPAKDRQPTFQI